MLQQLLQGQAKGSLEMNHKLVEINSKIESLTSRVQIIESSSAHPLHLKSLLEHSGAYGIRSMEGLGHGRSSTGYAKEEGGSHLEDQLDHLLDQPVEFLNSTGQASTRSS
ncbi:unnamed protein product [Microthlaspi erraticum]|uniref:Uncharacterized protein n=1 Tax=Microthlaspi erraticum TaxID=1685480 RepID=A0A6D2JJ28_9BRAS|nr:unnamed protein product [Microthlaspi erraticum]